MHATGEGVHIDVSMLDGQLSLLSYLGQYYLTGGLVPGHQGRAHVSIPTYNTFLTRDGVEIVIAANTQDMWRSLCGVLGRSDLVAVPEYATNADRLAHRDRLVPILAAEFITRDSEPLLAALVAAEVPAAPINPVDVALADPQARQRDMVVRMRHRSGREMLTLGVPIKSATAAGQEFRSPPALGGSTAAVLAELGYSPERIAELAAAGVVNAA